MKASEVEKKELDVDMEDENSLRGTLFSSIIFVGGGIVFFIILLFVFYMIRV